MSTLKVKIHLPADANMRDVAERFARRVVEHEAERNGAEVKDFEMKRE